MCLQRDWNSRGTTRHGHEREKRERERERERGAPLGTAWTKNMFNMGRCIGTNRKLLLCATLAVLPPAVTHHAGCHQKRDMHLAETRHGSQ